MFRISGNFFDEGPDLRVGRVEYLRLDIGAARWLACAQCGSLQDGLGLIFDVEVASLIGAMPRYDLCQPVLRGERAVRFLGYDDEGVDVRIGRSLPLTMEPSKTIAIMPCMDIKYSLRF